MDEPLYTQEDLKHIAEVFKKLQDEADRTDSVKNFYNDTCFKL